MSPRLFVIAAALLALVSCGVIEIETISHYQSRKQAEEARKRKGPTSAAQWEGWSEAEGLRIRAAYGGEQIPISDFQFIITG